MVADGDGRDGIANRFDDARALVTGDERQRRPERSFDRLAVRLAEAGGSQPYEHLAGADRAELHVLDPRRGAEAPQDDSARADSITHRWASRDPSG